ncbi:hypothetical protein [Parasitella parasitica]|uniref:Reverse transcriptase domain-containing protein n=1 Tax=Parasitella parasitica TaxID=35722 RepID=A0A0B7NE01_9FUNG|nr:hypothetical protein [Parasitella parasitica]
MEPIDIDDLLEEGKLTPRKSSPGPPDGLPYEVLYHVLRFPPYQGLISEVYNTALQRGIFPSSRNESVMCLLILNRRIMEVSSGLISRHQLEFLPGRFIAENGMICQLIMEDAQRNWAMAEQRGNDPQLRTLDADIGLLLDQEKAYNRVNLVYMKRVLLKFGFPGKFVTCISKLMGDNLIHININGPLSSAVAKLRGLKQGDPLSPILYNLAFEPFLLLIIHDRHFSGYVMGQERTKILCYTDDALVFVHNASDLGRLQVHMDRYCAASNTKFNHSKLQAFSVSGHNTWKLWEAVLTSMNIMHLHSVKDEDPLIYLGFPLIQSRLQRVNFVEVLITKLKVAVQLHSTRSLSVVGRATVLNSLILSRIWYVLRVTPLTLADFQQLRSTAIQFLRKNIFLVIPWRVWTLPRAQGGLGV